LTPSRKHAAPLLAILAGAAVAAYSSRAISQEQPTQSQPPAATQTNANLVVLDPAHGGPDAGATLGDKVPEKFTTLAVASQLRTALKAAGFTVIETREGDSSDPLTTDQRAEIANRAHAVACIVLHATSSGSGVHVYTSDLQPSDTEDDAGTGFPTPYTPIPWDMAQAGSVSQSLRLAGDIKSALTNGNLPAVGGKAPIRPLDNLICPAVAVEMAPLVADDGTPTPATDAAYQRRVVNTLTSALKTWRSHANSPAAQASATQANWIKPTQTRPQ
jgi:N-acetylmuramoyl-L-alanine amidase